MDHGGENLSPSPKGPSDGGRILKIFHFESGFSLIELILVMVIVVILAAVVGLNISSVSTVRLDQAVNKVVGDLRYAQQRAVATQTRHGITVDNTGQYTIHQDLPPDTAIPNPVNLGTTLVVNFNTYQQGQLAGVVFTSAAPFCGGAGAVMEFNSLGAPTDTNGTVLGCNTLLSLSYSGNTRTITIYQNTGNLSY